MSKNVSVHKRRGYVDKTIRYANNQWSGYPDFERVFPTPEAFFSRTRENYQRMADLGVGPKIISTEAGEGPGGDPRIVIRMEYLPTRATIAYLQSHEAEARALVAKMYGAGFGHGDLYEKNIRISAEGKMLAIDFDTLFSLAEAHTNPLVKDMAEHNYDYTVERLMEYESSGEWIFAFGADWDDDVTEADADADAGAEADAK